MSKSAKLDPAIVREHLRKASLFDGLSEESRRSVARICMPRIFAKKEVLFTEGEQGSTMFTLCEGSVQLKKAGPGGQEVPVRTVKKGETFAEVILFEKDRYPVTATALTQSTVLGFLRDDIIRLLDDRDFRRDFITMLMQKQRILLERLRTLTTDDVEERLFRFLKDQHGENERIELKLSKKDVAEAIGTTPETLSRIIQRLKKNGLLSWEGKTLTISPEFWNR